MQIKLNPNNLEHRRFVSNGNIDPITQEFFKFGDRVIVRAYDQEVWRYDSWVAYGNTREKTLIHLPKNKSIRIGSEEKRQNHLTIREIQPTPGGLTTPSSELRNAKKNFVVKARETPIKLVLRKPSKALNAQEKETPIPPKRNWWQKLKDWVKNW